MHGQYFYGIQYYIIIGFRILPHMINLVIFLCVIMYAQLLMFYSSLAHDNNCLQRNYVCCDCKYTGNGFS